MVTGVCSAAEKPALSAAASSAFKFWLVGSADGPHSVVMDKLDLELGLPIDQGSPAAPSLGARGH